MVYRASLLPFRADENRPGIVAPVVFRLLFPLVLAALAGLLSGCSPSSYNQITFSNATDWSARLTLLQPADGALTDQATLTTSLQAQGLQPVFGAQVDTPAGKAQLLELSGMGGADQLRRLIFGELGTSLNPLGSQTALTLQGAVHTGQILTFTFETNPTTGYSWQAEGYDPGWLQPAGSPSFADLDAGIGSPAKQVTQFIALQDGIGTIRWVYRRPWEAEDVVNERSMSIQAPELATISDLSDPLPALASSISLPAKQDVPIQTFSVQSIVTLPVSFDWRNNTTLTPVRNQGGCGSCWAFATVGVLESAMAIHYGSAPDLSEQYLISCNTYGWGCNGGFTAHDFHENTPGEDGAGPGAVLESSLPYTGRDDACKGPYDHPVRINDWRYIYYQGSDLFHDPYKPAADQIKQAILLHGPVETTVCAGSKWGSYAGGVFSADESAACGGSVNHAVDLVGWNDAMLDAANKLHKVWIVRNSWGSGWGDHGYMYLDQGISNIGYATSYVDYDGSRDLTPQSNACPATKILACGSQVQGNNIQAGSTDQISSYTCSTRDESGPEVTYQLAPNISGHATVSLSVQPNGSGSSAYTPDLDVFALNAQGGNCTSKTCMAFGDNQVSFNIQAGQPVYLNVDGNHGDVGSYTLSVSCDSAPLVPTATPEATDNPQNSNHYPPADGTPVWTQAVYLPMVIH